MKSLILLMLCALPTMGAFANESFFQSPSGNIYCEGYDDSVSCIIFDTTKGYNGCAYIIGADDKKARKECAPDGSIDGQPVKTLAYGKSINGTGWTCTSQKTGMRCVNKSGKGFQLSRASQRLF